MLRAQKFHQRHRSKMHNGILYFINERIAFLKKVIELVFTGYWIRRIRLSAIATPKIQPEHDRSAMGFDWFFLTSCCVI